MNQIPNGQVQLFDLKGTEMIEQNIVNETEMSINTSKLSSAPYFYVIKNNSMVIGSGIIIKQ
jgi:hypothetical protein